jgi:hypothetical protein
MKRDTSYADKRIAEVLERPFPKRLKGVFDKYPVNSVRTDAMVNQLIGNVNPPHLLEGGKIIIREFFNRNTGETEGRARVVILACLVHELQFCKVERHSRKAIKRFNKVAKSMVRGLLSEVKRHG